MGWSERVTVTTDPHARRGAADDCTIARAARQKYGGEWSVAPAGAVRTDEAGRRTSYRVPWRAKLLITAFDLGLPVGRRRVTLVRRQRGLLVLRLLPLVAVATAAGWLVAAGYWWTLALAVWFALMGVAALVAHSRAAEREWAASRAAGELPAGTVPARVAREGAHHGQQGHGDTGRQGQPGQGRSGHQEGAGGHRQGWQGQVAAAGTRREVAAASPSRAAGTTRTATPASRPAPTARSPQRTTAPDAAAREWLPARSQRGRPG